MNKLFKADELELWLSRNEHGVSFIASYGLGREQAQEILDLLRENERLRLDVTMFANSAEAWEKKAWEIVGNRNKQSEAKPKVIAYGDSFGNFLTGEYYSTKTIGNSSE